MVWHRGSGVGVVALANSKYAPVTPLSMKTLRLLQRELPDLLARRPLQAAARTLEAAEAALTWLREGDDAVADAWFADNMDPDISRQERRRRGVFDLAAGARGPRRGRLDRGRHGWGLPPPGAPAPPLRGADRRGSRPCRGRGPARGGGRGAQPCPSALDGAGSGRRGALAAHRDADGPAPRGAAAVPGHHRGRRALTGRARPRFRSRAPAPGSGR